MLEVALQVVKARHVGEVDVVAVEVVRGVELLLGVQAEEVVEILLGVETGAGQAVEVVEVLPWLETGAREAVEAVEESLRGVETAAEEEAEVVEVSLRGVETGAGVVEVEVRLAGVGVGAVVIGAWVVETRAGEEGSGEERERKGEGGVVVQLVEEVVRLTGNNGGASMHSRGVDLYVVQLADHGRVRYTRGEGLQAAGLMGALPAQVGRGVWRVLISVLSMVASASAVIS